MSAAGTVLAVAAASAEAAGMPCLIDRLSHPNAKALLEVPRLHLHTPRSEGRTSASLSGERLLHLWHCCDGLGFTVWHTQTNAVSRTTYPRNKTNDDT